MRAAFMSARILSPFDRIHGPRRGWRAGRMAMQLACLLALAWLFESPPAAAQTPSPMQEWQYSGGIVLARLFEPHLPEWRTVAGLAAEVQPIYDGANAYKVRPGAVINVRYRDIAFLSAGEGLGVNILH